MTVQFSHNSHLSVRRGGLVRTGVIGGLVVFLGFGLFVSLVVLAIAGIFVLTRPVVDASEQFLTLVGEGKIAEAYAATADGLRAQQDEASFTRAITQLGLTEYASATWHNREINNHDGMAEGTVHTKDGHDKPIYVQLVHEDGQWRVVGLKFGGLALALLGDSPLVPPAEELELLATATLLDFDKAVKAQDFTSFYANLSELWRGQTTPEQLKQSFEAFIDKQVDIAAISTVTPQLTSPASLCSSSPANTRPILTRSALKWNTSASNPAGNCWASRSTSARNPSCAPRAKRVGRGERSGKVHVLPGVGRLQGVSREPRHIHHLPGLRCHNPCSC
jgi:hypothetical protein